MRRVAAALVLLAASSILAAAQDDHAGHDEPEVPDDHAEHTASASAGADAPRTPVPALDAAARAAAIPPATGDATHDHRIHGMLMAERLEIARLHGAGMLAWEVEGWVGTDLDRLWLYTEGEREQGALAGAHAEALYGRSIAVWWDVLAGLRHDLRPGDGRTWAAFGVQGLAPQRIEVRAMAYVTGSSRMAAQLAASYELLVTNRFILQPALQLDLHARDDVARGIGSGLTHAEAGLRARFEFTRRIAPYVGIEWRRAFGATADLRRAFAEPVSDTRLVAGLRTWF